MTTPDNRREIAHERAKGLWLAWKLVAIPAVVVPESMTVSWALIGVWIVLNSTLVFRWECRLMFTTEVP